MTNKYLVIIIILLLAVIIFRHSRTTIEVGVHQPNTSEKVNLDPAVPKEDVVTEPTPAETPNTEVKTDSPPMVIAPVPVPAPIPVPDTVPPPKSNDVVFVYSMTDAIKKSKELNKKILVFFHAPWCGACETMKDYFPGSKHPNKDVKTAMLDYVVFMCNTDVDRAMAKKYGIYGLPTYIIIDENENIIKSGVGGLPARQFISWLNISKSTKPKARFNNSRR